MTPLALLAMILAIFTAVAVHEAAHALAMRRHGIATVEAGIGMPLPPRITIYRRGRFRLIVTPWLFGAYVKPDPAAEHRLEALPYRERAWIYNAGIIANLVLGFALTATLAGFTAKAALFAGLAAAIWLARRFVAARILPALAIPALVAFLAVMVNTWRQGETGVGFAGMADVAPHGLREAVLFAAVINLALAIFNALPIYPLDNARVCVEILARYTSPRTTRRVRLVGAILIALSLAGALISDVYAIVF